MSTKRVAAGVPTGGQFAAVARAESNVRLTFERPARTQEQDDRARDTHEREAAGLADAQTRLLDASLRLDSFRATVAGLPKRAFGAKAKAERAKAEADFRTAEAEHAHLASEVRAAELGARLAAAEHHRPEPVRPVAS